MAQSPERLRAVAVASFIPGFPLLLAHGVASHSAVPATGLVPLAFSSGFSLFILLHQYRSSRDSAVDNTDPERQPLLSVQEPATSSSAAAAAAVAAPPETEQQQQQQNGDGTANQNHDVRDAFADMEDSYYYMFPMFTFIGDVFLAASILLVLVYTWKYADKLNGQLGMLAAYGTLPLLLNVFIHLFYAVCGLSSGLALPGLTRWAAWQIVPGECPGCGHHLRPESTPEIPWYSASQRAIASAREGDWSFLTLPALPALPAWRWGGGGGGGEDRDGEDGDGREDGDRPARGFSQWFRPPAWFSYGAVDERNEEHGGANGHRHDGEDGRDGETARLFVDRDASGYHDDDDDDTHVGGDVSAPEAEVVVGKKKAAKR